MKEKWGYIHVGERWREVEVEDCKGWRGAREEVERDGDTRGKG